VPPNLSWSTIVLLVLIGVAEAQDRQQSPLSPRLWQLQQQASADQLAVEAFWREVAGKCPLVEPTDDPKRFLVTFLWRGDSSVLRIEARGGPYEHSRDPFERLTDTDVWYRSETLPADSRYVYGLIVTKVVEQKASDGGVRRELVDAHPLDPLNPNIFNEGSILELPDAPKNAWHIPRPDVPKGELQRFNLESAALNETRGLRLYAPAKFDPRCDHAFAVFLDGEDCERLMAIPVVLDNLIADGDIPPTVALLVDSQETRGHDLVFSEAFVRFLTEEAVPWAATQRRLRLSPKTTLIGGMSLGGLTAAYAAQQRSDVFGNVLSQSGAFWRSHPEKPMSDEAWFPGEIAQRAPIPVRYYLEVGRFESPDMIDDNHRMREVLNAKGNDVIYKEYNGGHDHVNWRVSVGNGIRALLSQRHGDAANR
jgi:enterochelin esterase-like enzyme